VNSADAYASLRKAVVFASYKIGAVSAADGFLTAQELDSLAVDIYRMR
jgi:ribokinase